MEKTRFTEWHELLKTNDFYHLIEMMTFCRPIISTKKNMLLLLSDSGILAVPIKKKE